MLAMKLTLNTTVTIGLLATAAPAFAAGDAGGGAVSTVHFQNRDNQPVGEGTLRQTPNGILLMATLRDLPPGPHGFHIHETGTCLPPFESAGGHFAPEGRAHGFADAKGPHAGDLPNLVVSDDGKVTVEMLVDDVTLDGDERGSLIDADGSSIVVHAKADDYRTDPAGASGDRIVCGIIEKPRTAQAAAVEPRVAERPKSGVPADVSPAAGQAAKQP